MILTLLKRDVRVQFRSGGGWALGIGFFIVFMTLCAIGLGGNMSELSARAVSLTWLAVILSALLSFPQIFAVDMSDGTYDHLWLSGQSFIQLCVAKSLSLAVTSVLPLIVFTPIAALAFGMSSETILYLVMSLVLGTPAIIAYGVFASALSASRQSSGFLVILISVPFLIPVLIFGISSVDSLAVNGYSATELRALVGLSMISYSLAIPAAAAALKINLE